MSRIRSIAISNLIAPRTPVESCEMTATPRQKVKKEVRMKLIRRLRVYFCAADCPCSSLTSQGTPDLNCPMCGGTGVGNVLA